MIRKPTIGVAWLESLRLFTKTKELSRYYSLRGGPSWELENLIFEIAHPTREPKVSPLFPEHLHGLVADFTEKLITRQIGQVSTTNERLYSWTRRDGTKLDQVALINGMLQSRLESRKGIIGFWDPDIDPFIDKPVSPLLAYFRVRSQKLHSTVIARSVEAWMGALPILVGFANLQEALAQQLNTGIGGMTFIALSYHLFETDLPIIQHRLEGE